jgi:DNA-directed RNA polymerase subunit RPC12/RpoP
MADPVPAGSDVSSGTYKCANCGYELQVGSTKNLPPCQS